jgi:hypothetical protein
VVVPARQAIHNLAELVPLNPNEAGVLNPRFGAGEKFPKALCSEVKGGLGPSPRRCTVQVFL